MNKAITKISLILFVIILLPVSFITFREITSLNENEKVIEDIYKKQLDAILFSVNQYSDDIVRSWSIKLETLFETSKISDPILLKQILSLYQENKSIELVFVSDSTMTKNIVYQNEKDYVEIVQKSSQISSILWKNVDLIKRLDIYREKNFLKIEPLVSPGNRNIKVLAFMLANKSICGFVINKSKFIKRNLGLKIQSVEREEFSAAVFDSSTKKNIYSTDAENNEYQASKSLWLFPEYSLGISLKGASIENIVRERTKKNFLMITGMGFLMLFAAWFGFKNIKREVDLAQTKSDFVSNVSHELRTPLALISMFTETLAMGRVKNEEKRNEYYGIIQHEIDRLSRIVNKILSFSKIEAGKWKYNFAQTEINSLVKKIFDTYKFHLQNKGFDFVIEDCPELIMANIDPEAISESVINLIDNAIKYSDGNKKVIVRYGIENKKVFIEVEDLGIGISSIDQKKIFEKFFRVASGNVHEIKGTGLGLTLVKHIMEAHQGEIKLMSELGKGSKFKLLFPRT
jgi:two-component system, OmpR family, phosphate regulon sensor histidine kinase PhoR